MIPGGQSLEVVATGLVVESENIGPLKHKSSFMLLHDQQRQQSLKLYTMKIGMWA
jgi:hypothetical protein